MVAYRPEIDGLRALAVGLVLAFHLGFAQVSGGFVGVDVFFVISGYVITASIVREGGEFRFLRFVWRRIRRLFPAVLVTAAATCAVASLILRTEDFVNLGRSAVAAALSVSNILFWAEAGYWDTSSKLKPLLHTWSLGVEEQFYLVWPFLIVLAGRMGHLGRIGLLSVITVAGFLSAEAMIDISPSAAFYLAPFRVGEFALGALVAALHARFAWRPPPGLSDFMMVLGGALIIFAATMFSGETRFPGYNALVPCLGAALVVGAGRTWAIGQLFSNPASVYVGKLSYSIYLVHWPILALSSYVLLRNLTLVEQGVVTLATLLLAAALHHLVEAPLRLGRADGGGASRPVAAVTGLAIIAAALAAATQATATTLVLESRRVQVLANNPASVPVLVDMTYDEANSQRTFLRRTECPGGCMTLAPDRLNVLVIGDSHGIDAYNMVRIAWPDANILFAGRADCYVFVSMERYYAEVSGLNASDKDACLRHNANLYGAIDDWSGVDVVIFNNWMTGAMLAFLDETLQFVRARTSADIIIFGNAPTFRESLPTIVHSLGLTPGAGAVPAEMVADITWRQEGAVRDLAERHGARFISKADFFCKVQCSAFVGDTGYLVTYDSHHMSRQAADLFGKEVMVPEVRKMGAN